MKEFLKVVLAWVGVIIILVIFGILPIIGCIQDQREACKYTTKDAGVFVSVKQLPGDWNHRPCCEITTTRGSFVILHPSCGGLKGESCHLIRYGNGSCYIQVGSECYLYKGR